MKIFIFPIKAQTWPRVTQNDLIWLRIPEEEIKSKDGLYRRRRIIRYNEYKTDVLAFAKEHNFDLPHCGAAIYFFMPMPIRWSKSLKKDMNGSIHQRRPDNSNLLKAFEDALTKKDEKVGLYSGIGKFWVDSDEGWIRVEINCPPVDQRLPVFDHDYTPGWNEMNKEESRGRVNKINNYYA